MFEESFQGLKDGKGRRFVCWREDGASLGRRNFLRYFDLLEREM
jgi:hypothetical protein